MIITHHPSPMLNKTKKNSKCLGIVCQPCSANYFCLTDVIMMIIKIWHETLTKLWYRLWDLLVLRVEKHGKVRERQRKIKNKENDLAKRKVAATQQNSSKVQAKLKQNLSKTQAKPKQNSSKVRLRGKDEALPPNFVCACAAIRAGPHRRRAVQSAGLHHVPAQLPAQR